MFEASVLARQGVTAGLVFVATDHGFALGHDPAKGAPLTVARLRGDSLDSLLWANLGRRAVHRYHYDTVDPRDSPQLLPWAPLPPQPFRIEGESLWPPLGLKGSWIHPHFNGASCVSRNRTLRARAGDQPVEARLAVPFGAGSERVLLGWVHRAGAPVWVRWSKSQAWLLVSWEPSPGPCERSQALQPVDRPRAASAAPGELEVRATSGELDYLELLPPKRKGVDN
jgi:hypothetical protein